MKKFNFKSIAIVSAVLATIGFTSVPVSAWSNSGDFSNKLVSTSGWTVFTLNQSNVNKSYFNISYWGKGDAKKITVEVFNHSGGSRTREYLGAAPAGDESGWTEYGLDPNVYWNIDAKAAPGPLGSYRSREISGAYALTLD